MNPNLRIVIATLVIAATALSARAQVNLNLSQSSIGNTFAGSVTVTITGLTNGETVLLEKYRDSNANGTVDASDLLQSYYLMTDGVVTTIGGVRNENVPGDEDLVADGSIRETFDFRSAGDVHNFVGGYLVRVSSPTARFASITQAFTVTQTPFAQTISGVVTNGSFAAVVLFANGSDGDLVAGTFADAAGAYSIKAPAGSYQVLAVKPGSVSGSPQLVTLNTNDTLVINLFVIAGGPTLSGKVADSSSGTGLPALMINLSDTNGAFALAFTDSGGNFSAPVTPGSWRISVESDGLDTLGYVQPLNFSQTNYNTVTGSVANINFAFAKANGLVYGFLRDLQSNGIPGVEILGSDSSSQAGTFSGTNGYFAFGVAASTNLGVMPDEGDLAARGLFANATNVVVGTNQAVLVNIFARPVTAYLRGRIFDNNGEPVSNPSIVVQPSPVMPGNSSFYRRGDADGSFAIGLYGGNWNLALECVEADQRNLVSFSKDFTVVDGVDQNNISLTAFYSTQTITVQVRQTNNSPITNLRVFGGATINGTNYVSPCASTDGVGNTTLKVINGNWTVSLDEFALNSMGFAGATNTNVSIAGNNGNVIFVVPRFTEVRPNIGVPTFGSGQFNLNVVGASGAVYRLEASTNLTTWTLVSTHTAVGGSFNASIAMLADRFRFFRITLGP